MKTLIVLLLLRSYSLHLTIIRYRVNHLPCVKHDMSTHDAILWSRLRYGSAWNALLISVFINFSNGLKIWPNLFSSNYLEVLPLFYQRVQIVCHADRLEDIAPPDCVTLTVPILTSLKCLTSCWETNCAAKVLPVNKENRTAAAMRGFHDVKSCWWWLLKIAAIRRAVWLQCSLEQKDVSYFFVIFITKYFRFIDKLSSYLWLAVGCKYIIFYCWDDVRSLLRTWQLLIFNYMINIKLLDVRGFINALIAFSADTVPATSFEEIKTSL